MFAKLSLAITLFLAAIKASDDFLGLERILQVQGNVFTATCTSDASCAIGNCCADYRRINGAVVTNVTKTCVNPLLNGRTVLFNGLNHTWSCLNQSVVAPSVGALCSSNSACTAAGSCCLSRSFSVFGVNQTAGTFCGAQTSSRVTTFQQYSVGVAPSNFTTNATYYSQCLASSTPSTTPSNPDTSSASIIQIALLAVFAAISVVLF